ncbi:hypothetical protein M758_UG206500 [Ceratodon purpureus]|nr:hypothetical protein M758_UG206500 [Ceratodon purpureus]
MEMEVNWAEFAFKQTHPHQSHCPLPRLLPEYANLPPPLPPLKKTVPSANFKEQVRRLMDQDITSPFIPIYPAQVRDYVPRAPSNVHLSSTLIAIPTMVKTNFISLTRPTPETGMHEPGSELLSLKNALLADSVLSASWSYQFGRCREDASPRC